MLFNFKYQGASRVTTSAKKSALSFVPDAGREPVWFQGKVREALLFREAISAMHEVVISDLRYVPKDREEYKRWLKSQEELWLAEIAAEQSDRVEEVARVRKELKEVTDGSRQVMSVFWEAQRKYWDYLYKHNRDYWLVFDPVISVHPDQVFFECFSGDESTYACFSCQHAMFEEVGDYKCGTTNIDYSSALYEEFQKMRGYRRTELKVEAGGFEVATEGEAFEEKKIDLPDSWVRGFLQVSSAMTMDAVELQVDPMDLHNLLFVLKRKKEKVGPRSLRFVLKPGEPVKVVIDPWGIELICRRSSHDSSVEQEIRVWGRRRLLTLERLLPKAQGVLVRLLGYGMPSFWMVDLGAASYTLGLSGWTANDWSRAGQFDLLAPRGEVSEADKVKVLGALRGRWFGSVAELAQETGLPAGMVGTALVAAAQAGRAVFDLKKQVWRARDLTGDPLPLEALRFANEREEKAAKLVEKGVVKLHQSPKGADFTLYGKIKGGKRIHAAGLKLDEDNRLREAHCSCNFFQQNKLRLGPCEHLLALRMEAGQ